MTHVKTPTSKEANYQTVLTNKALAILQSERQQCTPPPSSLYPLTPVLGGVSAGGFHQRRERDSIQRVFDGSTLLSELIVD